MGTMGRGMTYSEGLYRQLSRHIQNTEARATCVRHCNESGVKLTNMMLKYAANPGASVLDPANMANNANEYMNDTVIPIPTVCRFGCRDYFYAQMQ